MPRLARALQSPTQREALLKALRDLCRVEWDLRRHSLQTICNDYGLCLLDGAAEVGSARVTPPEIGPGEPVLPALDAWALAALAKRWPLGGGCLRYALALGRRLARTGSAPTQLVLGARKSLADRVEAHAWLLHAGVRYELPPTPSPTAFVPLRRAGLP